MATTCAIICSINSSQESELDSGHQGLTETRTNEFLFELDIDNNEAVSFGIDDFTQGNTSYTIAVTAIRDGQGPSETWTYNGEGCVSPEEVDEGGNCQQS